LFGGAVDECFVIENALSDIAAANFLKDSSRVPERLAHLGATNLDTIEMDPDMKIRVYGDVAVAINRATIKEKYSGKPPPANSIVASCSQKMPTGWQLVCNQINPITSPQVRRSFFLNREIPARGTLTPSFAQRHARPELRAHDASSTPVPSRQT